MALAASLPTKAIISLIKLALVVVGLEEAVAPNLQPQQDLAKPALEHQQAKQLLLRAHQAKEALDLEHSPIRIGETGNHHRSNFNILKELRIKVGFLINKQAAGVRSIKRFLVQGRYHQKMYSHRTISPACRNRVDLAGMTLHFRIKSIITKKEVVFR